MSPIFRIRLLDLSPFLLPTALMEPDEQLLADMKRRRAIRRPFHRPRQRAGNLLDCFPSRRFGWPCPFHGFDPVRSVGQGMAGGRVRRESQPLAAVSEMILASRVLSGHGFPATIKNPQPYGMRLASFSAWAV